MKKLILVLSLISFSAFLSAQDLQFFREDILFTVDTGFITIHGDYYFRNVSNRRIKTLIRYPVSSLYSDRPFDTLMVFDSPDLAKPLETVIKDTTAQFYITVPPMSQKVIQVFYRQHHNGSRVRYILTTALNWQKPLEIASYSLVINKKLKIKAFSLSPERSEDFGDSNIYYWKRENFMPDREFEVSFSQ